MLEYRPVPNGKGAVEVRRRVATSAEGPIDHIQVCFRGQNSFLFYPFLGKNLCFHLNRSSTLMISTKKKFSTSSNSSIKQSGRKRGRRRPRQQQQPTPLLLRGRRRRTFIQRYEKATEK